MQNAKDTFYVALRSRLACVNPARTVTLRAVSRPGIMVCEAEAPAALPQLDVFAVSWTGMEADLQLPTILTQMTCEIQYSTVGTQTSAGLDRGRALAEMDYEVLQLLYPYATQKMRYTTTPATPMETMVFWSEPQFGAAVTLRDRLSRTVKVTVFAFQEQGEQ
jgi:hypothetical protein